MTKYKCLRCGFKAKLKSEMLLHLNNKNICEPILNDISLEELKKKIFKKFKCIYCKNNFSSKYSLNRHIKICKSITKLNIKKFNCEFCNKSFSTKYGVSRHKM